MKVNFMSVLKSGFITGIIIMASALTRTMHDKNIQIY